MEELKITEVNERFVNKKYAFHRLVGPDTLSINDTKTFGKILGKKFVLPEPIPQNWPNEKVRVYQEFIIDTDEKGNPIRHACDPEKLADYFGRNKEAPNYMTPVFFQSKVLTKYYSDPGKYTVCDGRVKCAGLWSLRVDNDHHDYVVVSLGDLGRDLSEGERSYWLSFNIPPAGRKISVTNARRAFLGQFAEPERADLRLKKEYKRFCMAFREAKGWDFFLPLHEEDEHCFVGLHLPASDNQAEFDSQLVALTKIMIDSLNEEAIAQGVISILKDDRGINKLEKYFQAQNASSYEDHIKFLRVLQNLRSTGAAHRKGSNYIKVIADLNLQDEGQQKVFDKLLSSACDFIYYLGQTLLPDEPEEA